MPRLLSPWVPLLLATACGPSAPPARWNGQWFERGDAAFRLAPPPSWSRVDADREGADLAFRAPGRSAVIVANATCHGHADPPLQVLANDLLLGTTERQVLLEEVAPLDGREARHQVVRLKLDGVPLIYDLYVIKNDGCVYDLVLVSSPRGYDGVADAFVGTVASFRARGAATR